MLTSIDTAACRPAHARRWMAVGHSQHNCSVLEATNGACADALAAIGGGPPLGLMAFDCIARRGVLGDYGVEREVRRIAAFDGGAPVAGFYTYGEIARTHRMRCLHNQTLVVLAVG